MQVFTHFLHFFGFFTFKKHTAVVHCGGLISYCTNRCSLVEGYIICLDLIECNNLVNK